MPLARPLAQKRRGQAVADCAAEEPTPVPRPGGRLCANGGYLRLPRHARQEFARRADTSCSPAKSRSSRAAPAVSLRSTTENSFFPGLLSGTSTSGRIFFPAKAAPQACHPNQEMPPLLRPSPLPPLLLLLPVPSFGTSHCLLGRALRSAGRPHVSCKEFPPFHQPRQPP